MTAAEFYAAFLDGWSSAPPPSLQRLAGRTLKWKTNTTVGAVSFAFATNAKAAGLLPHLPGEFRLNVRWTDTCDRQRTTAEVSWFQYTRPEEAAAFATLQRSALEKFLAQSGKAPLRNIYNYTNDATWLPRPNFDEFAYYFDVADAIAWGRWYAALLPDWLARFVAAPETYEDWTWRVLWPDAVRPLPAP